MLFNTYTFVLFFALALGMYHLPLPWRVKKFNLLWQSWLFYAAWNPPFVILLWISTLLDWTCAKLIYNAKTKRRRHVMLVLSLVANLGFLGFFKYGQFLLENFVWIVNRLGIDYHPLAPSIILPMGISFYTFVTLSYTLDVYFGTMPPAKSFLDYAFYVAFFPHLVAGPIIRAVDFLPQTLEPKRASGAQMAWGLSYMLLGLFEKVVVADGLFAPIVEVVYDGRGGAGFASAWLGTLAFAGQIFCDFAGYSTIALGAAACLGFWLPRNFNVPYAAIGFSDFWRRWHISLSTWLRDYLYIPLGGNKKGVSRTYVNLMLTMLIGGLWHGASWMFVIWGGMHGTLLCIERWIKARFGLDENRSSLPVRLGLAALTFIAVNFTWVFFRSDSLAEAFSITAAMLGLSPSGGRSLLTPMQAATVLLCIAMVLAVHWLMRSSSLEELAARTPWPVRSAALALMFILIVLMPGDDRAFIYFQF